MAIKNSKLQKQKKEFPTASVIGLSVVLAGVLIIVLIACVPVWSAHGKLSGRLDSIKQGELPFMTVYDPNLGNDLVNQGGTEKPLAGNSAVKARELLLAVAEKVSFSETGSDSSLTDYNYRLRFQTDNGPQSFFIKNGRIYYVEGTVRQYFTPDDPAALEALVEYLEDVLNG